MNFSSPKIFILLQFLLLVSLFYHVFSFDTSFHQFSNQTFQQKEKFHKLRKKIANRLQQINKPPIKTIHSPDGDIIDCVLFQNQPAFDHPLLKGHKPSDPPEIPRWYNKTNILNDNFQLWSLSGESCPEGTIPIIRITEQDILRAGSLDRFRKKSIDHVNSEITHEYVSAQFLNGVYHGGQATFNLWNPHVEYPYEFSLSQMWVVAGSGNDLNSLEVGWHVYPQVTGDNRSRLFIYWTNDNYKHGCLNLECPGFIQTNHKIVLGAPFSPTSTYNGKQYEISFMIWKDQKTGHWWLDIGPGNLIGYWPSSLLTNLKDHADRVDFGGEVLNGHSMGHHSSTQMGSGHFAEEGYGKAAYIRNMKLVDANNNLNIAENPEFYVPFPNCYDHKIGSAKEWGSYFYFGGPGKNIKCQ